MLYEYFSTAERESKVADRALMKLMKMIYQVAVVGENNLCSPGEYSPERWESAIGSGAKAARKARENPRSRRRKRTTSKTKRKNTGSSSSLDQLRLSFFQRLQEHQSSFMQLQNREQAGIKRPNGAAAFYGNLIRVRQS